MGLPLMPKATAVWLVENTALSFDQIANFCGLHPLEVRGIADGELATTILGVDPIANDQLTREEIDRCQGDSSAVLALSAVRADVPPPKPRRGARYTPLSKRQDRPDAIAWLIRNHPELSDAQVGRLVGTTKSTIVSVRERTHWNMQNIRPGDPVSLGLCTQIDLDENVSSAAKRAETKKKAEMKAQMKAQINTEGADDATLKPIAAAMPADDVGQSDSSDS